MDNDGYQQQDSAAATLATVGEWVPINFVVPAAGAITGWQPDIIGSITVKIYSGATGDYATGVFDIDYVTYE